MKTPAKPITIDAQPPVGQCCGLDLAQLEHITTLLRAVERLPILSQVNPADNLEARQWRRLLETIHHPHRRLAERTAAVLVR